ncbi:MAG: hypothetical protein ACRCX2_38595 [Paraclostridium sp.]
MSDYEFTEVCGLVSELDDQLTTEQLKELVKQLGEQLENRGDYK